MRFQQSNVYTHGGVLEALPIYSYTCTTCNTPVEKRQSFSDPPLTTCEQCGGTLRKIIHPVGIVFKGSGWYVNDSRSASPAAKAGSSSTNGDGSSSAKGDKDAAAAGSSTDGSAASSSKESSASEGSSKGASSKDGAAGDSGGGSASKSGATSGSASSSADKT